MEPMREESVSGFLDGFLKVVLAEAQRDTGHKSLKTSIQAWVVLREEIDEVWDILKSSEPGAKYIKPDPLGSNDVLSTFRVLGAPPFEQALHEELVQAAAVCWNTLLTVHQYRQSDIHDQIALQASDPSSLEGVAMLRCLQRGHVSPKEGYGYIYREAKLYLESIGSLRKGGTPQHLLRIILHAAALVRFHCGQTP